MNRGLFAGLLTVVLVALVLVVSLSGDDEATPGETADAITDTTTKPVVEVPEGEPPAELTIEDIVVGEGPAAEPGDQLVVQYVGVDYASGEQFDASWDTGQPFPFELAGGSVIEGWDEGVEGMQVGGRRQLVIPPDLAYGQTGSPPAIGPGATLVFVIDLVEIL